MIKRFYYTMEDLHIDIWSLYPGDEFTDKILKLVRDGHKYDWILFQDVEFILGEEPVKPEIDFNSILKDNWLKHFDLIFQATKQRYLLLLNLYKKNENKLLDKLGSTTTTKFNDTPQNGIITDDDVYTTSLTQSSTEVIPMETIDRLHNIYNKYDDLLDEWYHKFDGLFGNNVIE